jgi:hypothetical protein
MSALLNALAGPLLANAAADKGAYDAGYAFGQCCGLVVFVAIIVVVVMALRGK